MNGQTENPAYTALVEQLDAMQRQGVLEPAIDQWREQDPARLQTVTTTLNKLGIQLFNTNRIESALTWFNLALRATPDDAATLNNIGTCYKELGDLGHSTHFYRQALERQPGFAAAHSNLLMNLQYTPGITPAALAAAHRALDQRHAQALRPTTSNYSVTPDPDKKLRIGLVSSDLGNHPVGNLLVRYLENIDRTQFEFFAYADRQRHDPIADRIRASLRRMDDTRNLSDAELAQKIAADNIDILIDLAGHSGENRLGTFARKPAPVQIGWLGYPGDTGLSAMDYVIGDTYVLPQSMQPHLAAKILNLPYNFVCFDPPADAPPVIPLPALTTGHVTFGAFHNPVKCNDEVLQLWAAILRQIPQAKLRLKYKGFGEPLCQQAFQTRFMQYGIDSSRLEFQGASPMPEMFATLQTVDLMLDPFPFAGGMMTLLALWMGVPVITWPRETFASRQGLSFLISIGITDTLAVSRDDYVAKAVALVADLPRLADLRQKLRPAMAASPLCDGQNAATNLQYLLRKAWQGYCASA